MALDEIALSKALGFKLDTIHNNLCRSQLATLENSLNSGQELVVACTQEAPLFQEIADESNASRPIDFVNIRELAGWSTQGDKAAPKMAALLHASQFQTAPARLKSINSDGMCLVYGAGQPALEAAQLLSQSLSVTLLLSADEEVILPRISDVPIYRGDIDTATGSFGEFSLSVNNYAPSMPSARAGLDFAMARDGAKTRCSVILDLSGNSPLFTGHTHRDGYKRVDPNDPAAVLRAVIDLSDMVGEFEKPIYVTYNANTCAHSRSSKVGCNKCLDACPAGAITEAGEGVEIDSGICGGCGSCHAVCPTGSIDYQYPTRNDMIERGQVLLNSYLSAGGKNPVLLVHDDPYGADLIAALARYGRGLPANVIPLQTHAVSMIGHVEMAALLASGAQQIVFICDPAKADELSATTGEVALAEAILSGLGLNEDARCQIVLEVDPDALEEAVWSLSEPPLLAANAFATRGSKRDIARLAFSNLLAQSEASPDVIPLPANAPYGRLDIDTAACTLCMACTSACPANAIVDTPGEPTLRFIESACVQCGLCTTTCPESALSLVPQLNLTPAAMQPVTLYEEEPFCCVVCDTPFATKSTIDRISQQLAGKHAMFADSERAKLIQMCENCRVEAQANSSEDPFSGGDRPRVRTTEDYIEAERGNRSVEDFLMDD
ncbi:MAG: 4Fe-4S binding protein [Rhizobiaceae bacterium]